MKSDLPVQEYKKPDNKIEKLARSENLPVLSSCIDGPGYALLNRRMKVPLMELAVPSYKLAGIVIKPDFTSINPYRDGYNNSFTFTNLRFFSKDSGKQIKIADLPVKGIIFTYKWMDSGKYFIFTLKGKTGIELWKADLKLKKARQICSGLNLVLSNGFIPVPGKGNRIIVALAKNARKTIPELSEALLFPSIQQSLGKKARSRTFQNLLQNRFDELLFDFFATSELAVTDVNGKKPAVFSKPGLHIPDSVSPNARFLLVKTYQKPYSYTVPYTLFSRTVSAIDILKKNTITIADKGVTENIPAFGVETGPRQFCWNPHKSATIVYCEALDGGDPENKAEYRDKLVSLDVEKGSKRQLLKLKQRMRGLSWLCEKDHALVYEIDFDRRWKTVHTVNLGSRKPFRCVIEDISYNDDYSTMGWPVITYNCDYLRTVVSKDSFLFTRGNGASDKGNRPFLMKVNYLTGEREKVFECPEGRNDSFISFADCSLNSVFICIESPADFPNYAMLGLNTRMPRKLTRRKPPLPELTGIKRELIRYKRKDGVPLSGVLYYPFGYRKGRKVPAYIHAYPLEYSSKKTAGQIRGFGNEFPRFSLYNFMHFLFQGVAVFLNTQFPVVGDAKTMNDTFVEQLVMNARAARNALKKTGAIDVNRLGCVGHSYGAFMVANLLIHTDIFKTGIAQSGAYNRTLTPFGFQSERRTLWQASETYLKVSPFMHADKLNKPILLIHGADDNNSGTFPIQSDRLFAALKANKGLARYVKLPFESHRYSGIESILHVLWERYEWTEKYLKRK